MKQFSEEIIEELLAQITEGKSVRSICRQDGMPALRTVMDWRRKDDEFASRYEMARESGADAHADELRDLARQALEEPENANAIRVAADILKWTASKQNWRRYGDKVEQHVVNTPQTPEDVARRISQLESELSGLITPIG